MVGAGDSYVPTATDIDAYFRLVVTARSATSGTASTLSATVGPIVSIPVTDPTTTSNVEPPHVSGRVFVGGTLEASEGLWYAPPDTVFRYQWQRCDHLGCRDIAGAVASRYLVVPEDIGKQLRVEVTALSPLDAVRGTAVGALSGEVLNQAGQPAAEPRPLALRTPTLHPTGAELQWDAYPYGDFVRYEIHRAEAPGTVPSAATLVAYVRDRTATSYTDTTATPELTYTYTVVLVTTSSPTRRPSVERTVDLPPTLYTTKIVQLDPVAGRATFIYKHANDAGATCRNYGADPLLIVGTNSSQTSRALLQFDLTNIVPAGARVSDASLWLWAQYVPSADLTVRVQQVTTGWQEGSGRGSCSRDGASWNEAVGASPWSTSGGDFETEAWSRQAERAGNGGRWDRIGIGGLFNSWLRSSQTNLGLLLKTANEEATTGYAAGYASDDASPAQRPSLSVTYRTAAEDDRAVVVERSDPQQVTEEEDAAPAQWDACGAQVGASSLEATGDSASGTDKLPGDSGPGPTGPVCLDVRQDTAGDRVIVENDDGQWTIYLKCRVTTSNGKSVAVGPGYIGRFLDKHYVTPPNRVQPAVKLVEGLQPLGVHIQEAGGLGNFGLHFLRGYPSGPPQNNFFDLTAASDVATVLEGQRCARTIGDQGVYYSEVPGCPNPSTATCDYLPSGTGAAGKVGCSPSTATGIGAVIPVDVWHRDGFGETGAGPVINGQQDTNGIVRVRYRWVFCPEIVKMYATVTIFAKPKIGPANGGYPFVKEPKFVASLIGPPQSSPNAANRAAFPTMRVFSNGGGTYLSAKQRGCPPPPGCPVTPPPPPPPPDVVFTQQEPAKYRLRVRWDYNTNVRPKGPSNDPEYWNGVRSGTCTRGDACVRPEHEGGCTAFRACFSAIMMEYDPAAVASGAFKHASYVPLEWQSGMRDPQSATRRIGHGLDLWAVRSGARLKAAPTDKGTDTSCNGRDTDDLDDANKPIAQRTRQWEFAGRKTTPNAENESFYNRYRNSGPYLVSATLFHGWEGGRGYNDCENLYRLTKDGPAVGTDGQPVASWPAEEYGAYATFDLNDGWDSNG